MKYDQPAFIYVSPTFYELFLDAVDPWRREFKRAKRQLRNL